ncbi:hypothetical protein GR212_19695 [Rhizobium lusitanum]|uniref:Uncharacterized protein n=1 Tax=Rhizobium lusitanum TaxID=293958 RepID=A0A6L9U7A5_9HYPH|nr:hypothetical protein [Rhizobium lusitanum]NEI71813.1 hypothetical protein [Rhizobium lusitanum]
MKFEPGIVNRDGRQRRTACSNRRGWYPDRPDAFSVETPLPRAKACDGNCDGGERHVNENFFCDNIFIKVKIAGGFRAG